MPFSLLHAHLEDILNVEWLYWGSTNIPYLILPKCPMTDSLKCLPISNVKNSRHGKVNETCTKRFMQSVFVFFAPIQWVVLHNGRMQTNRTRSSVNIE